MNFSARRPILFATFLGLAMPASAQAPSSPDLASTTGRPVMTPDERVMQLDDLGLYQLSYVRRDAPERFYPVGWVGPFDQPTGVACQPHEPQDGKRSWLLHPPWLGGATGFARQTFTFALPRAHHIELRGATAMQTSNTQGSDGVTFRVKVSGKTRVDEHTKSTQWHNFSLDLTSYAGKTVTLAFESDAGPDNNSSFDFALWGARQLVLDGFTPPRPSHPAPVALPITQLATPKTRQNEVAPQGAYKNSNLITFSQSRATFAYAGSDGTFDYEWCLPKVGDDSPLGNISLSARPKTTQGQLAPPVRLPVADDARIEWINGIQMKRRNSQFQRASNGNISLVSFYEGGGKTAILRITAHLVGKSLVFDVTCDQPLVRSLTTGQWGPVMRRKPILIPYYLSNGEVYFLPQQNLFVNAFSDWTHSGASYIENHRATYNARTDGKYNLLRERAIFSPAWHLDEVLPNIPNPPSPYLREMGGKVVLDVWGNRYAEITRDLQQYHDYGLRNLAVIVHVWQRDGYDNGLPAHYPANKQFGTEGDMKQLVKTAVDLGYRIALHENYSDYYPNYEGFTESDISLRPDGSRETAWYNEGTKIQSFAIKPTAMVRLAQSQSPEIHRRYGTNANYMDVSSSVPPWFHVDARAGEAGASQFSAVEKAHRDLWAFERATHGGPVFGEGNKHWYWSGLLDGVEAQVQDGWNTSLLVDFDLLKIHALQNNEGMGYYARWWDKPNWNGLPPMQVLDRYRMQTLAFGHGAFLDPVTWTDLRLVWQENNLAAAVSARCAAARPTSITYQVNGQWVDTSAAARAGSRYDRLRVRYDNGLTFIANNQAAPLSVTGATLPQYGWKAEGAGILAYTAIRDGVTVDFAQTPTSTFANARNSATWNLNSEARTRVSATDFDQTGPRQFRLSYKWTVEDKYTENYHEFIHFSQPTLQDSSAVRFQDDHDPTLPTTQWQVGSTIDDGPRTIRVADGIADGDYEIGVGLFNDKGRRALGGDMDANGRAYLGIIRIQNGGQNISFVPPTDKSAERRRLYETSINMGGKVVDFGSVRTNGSVMLRREGNEWVMQTLPRDQKFVVQLSGARFGHPTSVRAVDATTAEVKTQGTNGGRWGVNLNGAREYRWKAGS